MLYSLEYTTRALRFLQSLPEEEARPLKEAMERLCDNPRPKGSRRRRKGEWIFALRIEIRNRASENARSYFVVYEIQGLRVVVVVLDVKSL